MKKFDFDNNMQGQNTLLCTNKKVFKLEKQNSIEEFSEIQIGQKDEFSMRDNKKAEPFLQDTVSARNRKIVPFNFN